MITVFGSINIDLVTRVERLPRPGETVVSPGYDLIAGGKGANQALAAARAGARVRLVGCVGQDVFAAPALSLLENAGVDLVRVARTSLPTGLAAIAVDRDAENTIVIAVGANGATHAGQLDDVRFGPSDTLLLQMEVRPEESLKLARRAGAEGARVILSLAPFRALTESQLRHASILLLNEQEALDLCEHCGLVAADGEAAAHGLAFGLELSVVVTLGARGAVATSRDGETVRVSAPHVKAVDTTGAGDTFAGVLAARLDAGDDLRTAISVATTAAAIACTRHGAQPSMPTADEIQRFTGS